jgi:hypothetical protein
MNVATTLQVPAVPEPGQKVVAVAHDAFCSSQHRALVLTESQGSPGYREYSVATWDRDFGLVWIECHIASWDEARERFALYVTEVPEK